MSADEAEGMAEGRLIVLVGPKGSGKTTIGRMLESTFGAHFLHVEAIAKQVLAEMGGVIDERYARRAFGAILDAIDRSSRSHPLVIIETTGASAETPAFLETLGARHELFLVRVGAARATCEARIVGRDQSEQVQVSSELVREMHERSVALTLPWDLELENDPPLSEQAVRSAFAPLLAH